MPKCKHSTITYSRERRKTSQRAHQQHALLLLLVGAKHPRRHDQRSLLQRQYALAALAPHNQRHIAPDIVTELTLDLLQPGAIVGDQSNDASEAPQCQPASLLVLVLPHRNMGMANQC